MKEKVMCEKCEYGKQKLLTPYDLFYIAVKHNTTTEDVIAEFCKKDIDAETEIPIISFKENHCPFGDDIDCEMEGKPKYETDETDKKWKELVTELSEFIKKRNFSKRELVSFQSTLLVLLYMCYNTKTQFYSQFIDRKETIERIIQNI